MLHWLIAILSVILTETANLLTLGSCVEFARGLRELVPTVLTHSHLCRCLDIGSHGDCLAGSLALAGLCTLTDRGLVHRLERVVARHASVVQVLLSCGVAPDLGRGSPLIVVTSLRHIDSLQP